MFRENESGNKAGRPKGSTNRTTKELKEILQEVLSEELNLEKVKTDLASLKPEQRLNLLIKLLPFCLPTLRSVDTQISEIQSFAELLK